MFDISALVTADGAVRAAASMFPVMSMLDSSGLSGTKFVLAQIPGTEDAPQWVACVWRSNPRGGDPLLMISEKVTRVSAFTTQNIALLLETGQLLTIRPDGGCGCGSRLKTWQPWGASVRLHAVAQPVPTPA